MMTFKYDEELLIFYISYSFFIGNFLTPTPGFAGFTPAILGSQSSQGLLDLEMS